MKIVTIKPSPDRDGLVVLVRGFGRPGQETDRGKYRYLDGVTVGSDDAGHALSFVTVCGNGVFEIYATSRDCDGVVVAKNFLAEIIHGAPDDFSVLEKKIGGWLESII